MIKVLYFASLRDTLGTHAEELVLPDGVADMAGLKAVLGRRGGVWGEAFGTGESVMMAVNQEAANPQTPLGDGDEVAFYPPVTGG